MKKIKVMQINKMYYPVTGGIEKIAQQIAEGLKDKTDMNVLVCQKKGKTSKEIINDVTVFKAGSFGILFSLPISFSFFPMFKNLTKDRDIIHIHCPSPLADIAISLLGFKGKVALWWHSDIIRQKKLMIFYKPFMKKMLDRADVIFVATEGHIKGYEAITPYAKKCVVVPFGVDKKMLEKSQVLIDKYSSKNEVFSFLFVGRLVEFKGCSYLIEAFSKLEDSILTIVGDGVLEDQLKGQVENLNLTDKVFFKGNLKGEELLKEFASCDVFVLPSIEKNESFGIVQLEAMTYGKPVINTSLPGGVPYVSLNNVTGFTVPPKNTEKLFEAMKTLKDNKELYKKFSESAYKRAREEFSEDKMLEKIYLEYEKLMK